MAKTIHVAQAQSKDEIIRGQAKEIQNLREMLNQGKKDREYAYPDANPCLMESGAQSSATARNILGASPPNRPSIAEAANRTHDYLDTLHAIVDKLVDKLDSVSTPYPKQAGMASAASPAVPTSCQHIATLEAAQDRIRSASSKLNVALDALMI